MKPLRIKLLVGIALALTLPAVQIEAQTAPNCGRKPLDAMLVFDRSDSMRSDGGNPPEPLNTAKTSAVRFVSDFDYTTARTGLASYAGTARLDAALSNNPQQLISRINSITTSVDTNISAGIEVARIQLNSNTRADAQKVIVLFTDGRATEPGSNTNARNEAINEATVAKNSGIRIVSIGLGSGADTATLRTIASSAQDYYFADNVSDMQAIYDRILDSIEEYEPTSPGSVQLNSPADGSNAVSNDVEIDWQNIGGWGNGCPTVASNDVQIQLNCTGAWVSRGDVDVLTNLEWGQTYCWRVVRSNGPLSTQSQIWRFNIPNPPSLNQFQFQAGSLKCNSSLSGRPDQSTTNNPLRISFVVSDDRNDFANNINVFQNLRVALVPSRQNVIFFQEVEPQFGNANRQYAGFRVNNVLSNSPEFTAISGNGSLRTNGDLASAANNATLLALNTAGGTRIEKLDNKSLRITWVIRLESTYASVAQMGIYGAVLVRTSNGSLVTQSPDPDYPTADGNLAYTKLVNWGVDMQSPSVAIGQPVLVNASEFDLRWQASDVNGLRELRSYCFGSTADSSGTLRDANLNQSINIGGQSLDYPSPDQCLINLAARLGNHRYQLTDYNLRESLQFRLYAQDTACNASTGNQQLEGTAPWLLSQGSNVSAGGGFLGINIPVLSSTSIAGLGSINAPAFLTTFIALAGNQALPNRASAHDTYAQNYTNLQSLPVEFGVQSWYDLIAERLNDSPNKLVSTANLFSGNLSAAYGVPVDSRKYIYHNGNVLMSANTRCDITAIIIINGNLRIDPNFNILGQNRCLFVVKGDVEILSGTYKSGAGQTSEYDRLYAFIISNGKFVTKKDRPGELADGLYIKGGVAAGSAQLGRELGLRLNAIQPAEVIEFDPKFLTLFQEELGIIRFSLRSQ